MSPTFYWIVIAATVKQVLSRCPFNELNILRVARKYCLTRIVIVIISLPNPYCLISTASCNQSSVVVECNWLHFVFMSFKWTYWFKIVTILLPNYGCSVERGWSETQFPRLLDFIPLNLSDCSRMSAIENGLTLAILDRPYPYGFVWAARCKQLSIWGKIKWPNSVGVSFENF